MSPAFEHDPHDPAIAIEGTGRAASWLRASSLQLGIRMEPAAGVAVRASSSNARTGTLLAIHCVRSPHGQLVTYPVAEESWSAQGVLQWVQVPAPSLPSPAALALQQAAVALVSSAGRAGITTVRFADAEVSPVDVGFDLDDSCAWTLDGVRTSLPENAVRAALDLPLGSPTLLGAHVASAAVQWAPGLVPALRHCMARDPAARIHLDAVLEGAGTTIGHVSVVSDDVADALRRARHAADYLTGTIEE